MPPPRPWPESSPQEHFSVCPERPMSYANASPRVSSTSQSSPPSKHHPYPAQASPKERAPTHHGAPPKSLSLGPSRPWAHRSPTYLQPSPAISPSSSSSPDSSCSTSRYPPSSSQNIRDHNSASQALVHS